MIMGPELMSQGSISKAAQCNIVRMRMLHYFLQVGIFFLEINANYRFDPDSCLDANYLSC